MATRSLRDGAPVLIWPVAHRHDEVRDGGVFGLAGAVADDGGPAGAASHFDRLEGLGDGADLVELDQDRVGGLLGDPLGEEVLVGDEQVVADELDLAADPGVELLPAGPVLFAEAVLEGDDRVLVDPLLPEVDHLAGVEDAAFALEVVAAGDAFDAGPLDEDGAGGGVKGDRDVVARLVAGLLDGLEDDLDGRLVGREGRREAALVALADGEAAVAQDLLEAARRSRRRRAGPR